MIGDTVEINIAGEIYDNIIVDVDKYRLYISPRDHFGEKSILVEINGEWKVDKLIKEHVVTITPFILKTPKDYVSKIIDNGKHKQSSILGGMTREQLKASGLVSLIHITYDIDNIIRTAKIDHRLSLSREGIPVIGGMAGAYFPEPTIEQSAYGQRQFPGIYSFIYSQIDFLQQKLPEVLTDDGSVTLVLPLSLMEQRNWHLNSVDNYGAINNITFTPKTLPSYLSKLMGLWGIRKCGYRGGDVCDPEIIFHDSIPLDIVELIIAHSEESKTRIESLLRGRNIPVQTESKELYYELAARTLFKGEELLSSAEPQYCYTGVLGTDAEDIITSNDVQGFNENNPYTLRNIKYKPEQIVEEDGYIWQKRLDLCGIKEIYTREREDELFKMIEDRMQQIYFEDAPRTPVQNEDQPPWKYTPEYYRKNK